MKITKLHINLYRQLRNLKMDFVYPPEHSKAGQPLRKVCIVGQSATGKTTILELIRKNLALLSSMETIDDKYLFRHFQLTFDGLVECTENETTFTIDKNAVTKNNKVYKNMTSGGGAVGYILNQGLKLLYLSAELISSEAIEIFNQNPLNILNEISQEKYLGLQKKFKESSFDYEFGKEVSAEIWFSMLYEILMYRKNFMQMASELINKGSIGDLTRLNNQFAKWSKDNKNPLIAFADYFNPILKKLNLEVDLVNTEYLIPIKSQKTDEVIPISGLSTGTKGLLLSMFPLFELDTSNSIVLLDEPERSLFPDMQIELMEYYQAIAPKAQFIVATHSPFIAAAFEPEERFILYFDEQGEVIVRRGTSPIGDDPNDILQNDFNVDYYNDFGKQAYKQYLELKTKLAQEKEPENKKRLIKDLAVLGDKYNFQ